MRLQTGELTIGWYINKTSSVFRELRSFETPVKFHIGVVLSHSVVSDSLWPRGLKLPGSSVHGDSPGKNPGVGCHDSIQTDAVLLYSGDYSSHSWLNLLRVLIAFQCLLSRDWDTSLGAFSLVLSFASILLASPGGQSPGRQLPEGCYVWSRGERAMQDRPGCSWGPGTRLSSGLSGFLLKNHILFSGGGSDDFYLNSLITSFIYPNKFFSQIKIMKCGGHIERLGTSWM